jgi:hypothetical protein
LQHGRLYAFGLGFVRQVFCSLFRHVTPAGIGCKSFSHVDNAFILRLLIGMNNAKFALAVATKLSNQTEHIEFYSYNKFLEAIRHKIPPLAGTEAISENVWQIHLENGLFSLAEILNEAKGWRIPVRVLFFEYEPDWIKHPPVVAQNASQ